MHPTRNIFICHASRDEEYVSDLVRQVEPVIESLMLDVRIWEDSMLFSGQEWSSEIHSAIDQSIAAVIVVSDHLLNSKVAMKQEMPRFLERAAQREIEILCLYARPCLIDEYVFHVRSNGVTQPVLLTKYQGLNSPTKPLESIVHRSKRKEALVLAARRLVATVKQRARPQMMLIERQGTA